MNFSALMLASVVVIIGPTGCANTATLNSARFLYVVDGEARIDKLDTVEGKRVATIELAERSALVPRVLSAHSGLDGCIAESVAYDAASVQVNVDVPTQTRVS